LNPHHHTDCGVILFFSPSLLPCQNGSKHLILRERPYSLLQNHTFNPYSVIFGGKDGIPYGFEDRGMFLPLSQHGDMNSCGNKKW
jgi:hypothetical protein